MRRIKLGLTRGILLIALGCAAQGFSAAAHEPLSEEPERIIDRAKQLAESIDEQGLALVRLAWVDDVHPLLASAARQQLVDFGEDAMTPLRQALVVVPRERLADVATVALEARRKVTSGVPLDYIPFLYEVLWFGSADARRLVIPAIATSGFNPAMLPMIDTAYDHPELAELVIQGLTTLRDDRARYFLDELLRGGTPDQQKIAAAAMGSIGGRCGDLLREAARAEDKEVRVIALQALLPVTGLDDLTALHEYIALYPDDDAELFERVRLRAIQLESLLEHEQSGDFGPGS